MVCHLINHRCKFITNSLFVSALAVLAVIPMGCQSPQSESSQPERTTSSEESSVSSQRLQQTASSNNGAVSCALVDSQIRKLESIRDSAQAMANRTTSPSMATAFINQAIQAQNQIISLSQKCG